MLRGQRLSAEENMMLKKAFYPIGFLIAVTVSSATVAAVLIEVHAAKAQSRASQSAPAWLDHPNPAVVQQPVVETRKEMFSEAHTADVIAIEQVWAAYAFYNDSMNGPGMASLFTPDGVDQHIWDDGHGKFIPDYGIVAPEDVDKNMTTNGPKGSGCVLHGRAQIDYYFGEKRTPVPQAWPGHSHHESPSMMVKVSDDGMTAVLSAPHIDVGQNDKGVARFTTGGHRAFFKKTSEGWEIAELYAIDDHPLITQGCDVNGPIGMRSKSQTN
jgi:hypothetical protein